MDYPPGRAPFDDEEDYKPMRRPKSTANTSAQTNSMNSMNAAFGEQLSVSGFQRTISPHKLSAFAPAFEPSKYYNENAQYFQNHHQQQQHQVQQQRQQPQLPQHPHLNQHQNHQHQHHQKNSRHQYQEHQQQQQQPYQHQQQQQFNNRQSNNYQQQERQNQFPHQNRNHHHQQQNHHHHQNHSYNNGFEQHHKQHHQHQPHQYQPQQQEFSSPIQNRLKIGAAASAAATSPNNYAASNNYNNYHSGQRQQQSYQHPGAVNNHSAAPAPPTKSVELETIALEYLQSVIICLNQNPGQFDSTATRFLNIFEGMENNNYVLCNAMEDIFTESIENPNFRYMGAKLYNLLHMLNLKKDSLFHQLLKCKLDYHQEEQIEYMKDPKMQQKVRETALFLAELYMQLRGDDSRIHLIAENIIFSLKQLLLKVNADNVRCICLTLKLAGYDLTADCPDDMKKIIEQLEAINTEQQGKFPLAANVISLQKNNWGRKLSSSSSVCDEEEKLKTAEPLRDSDEPIFYGPDGRELTADEAEFLTSNNRLLHTGTSSNDDEDVADLDVDFDPEMDEESENAFKEFIKQKVTS